MTYSFGAPFDYVFQPVDSEGRPVAPSDDPPAIYVYAERPAPVDAVIGAGDIIQPPITTWVVVNGMARKFTVAAIADPDPFSSVITYTYWLAINFRLETGGQPQLVLHSIEVSRVTAHHSVLYIDEAAIKAIWPGAFHYIVGNDQLALFISQAKSEIQAKLRSRGYEWSKINRPDQFQNALTYRTLALIAFSQIQRVGDHFEMRYREFTNISNMFIDEMQFAYDEDGDGTPDEPVSTGTLGYSFILR